MSKGFGTDASKGRRSLEVCLIERWPLYTSEFQNSDIYSLVLGGDRKVDLVIYTPNGTYHIIAGNQIHRKIASKPPEIIQNIQHKNIFSGVQIDEFNVGQIGDIYLNMNRSTDGRISIFFVSNDIGKSGDRAQNGSQEKESGAGNHFFHGLKVLRG